MEFEKLNYECQANKLNLGAGMRMKPFYINTDTEDIYKNMKQLLSSDFFEVYSYFLHKRLK